MNRPHQVSPRRCDVLVVGAGLAGLVAAHQLLRSGVDVQILEASEQVGGRITGEPGGPDTGAEFIGRPHTELRALIDTLELGLRPAGLDRAPILWRLPGSTGASRIPPGSPKDLWRLSAAWWQLRRKAMNIIPDRPWESAVMADLDSRSLSDWLAARSATQAGLDLTEALVGGFATRPITEVSAGHAACWISAAGGLLPALRSGQQYVVPGGAHQIPSRLAARLGERIHLSNPVTSIVEDTDAVTAVAADSVWSADAAVVAIPIPALRHLTLSPPPESAFQSALQGLSYGQAIKIAASTTVQPPVAHRSVVGGHPLAVAWRHHESLAGIATAETPTEALIDDLASSFGLRPSQLHRIAVTDWTQHPYIGGSYLVYRPGQILTHEPALRDHHQRRLQFAGTDFSSWPNSMQGAVQSGNAAATELLGRRP